MHKIASLAMFLAIAPAYPAPLGGYAAAHGIRAGSPVTYISMADTAREGFTRLRGTDSPKADAVNPILAIPESGTADFLPKVGDKVTGGETYIDSSAASSSASMILTLTALSATRPSLGVVARPLRAGPDRRAVSPGEGVYFGTGTGRALVDGNGREITVR